MLANLINVSSVSCSLYFFFFFVVAWMGVMWSIFDSSLLWCIFLINVLNCCVIVCSQSGLRVFLLLLLIFDAIRLKLKTQFFEPNWILIILTDHISCFYFVLIVFGGMFLFNYSVFCINSLFNGRCSPQSFHCQLFFTLAFLFKKKKILLPIFRLCFINGYAKYIWFKFRCIY